MPGIQYLDRNLHEMELEYILGKAKSRWPNHYKENERYLIIGDCFMDSSFASLAAAQAYAVGAAQVDAFQARVDGHPPPMVYVVDTEPIESSRAVTGVAEGGARIFYYLNGNFSSLYKLYPSVVLKDAREQVVFANRATADREQGKNMLSLAVVVGMVLLFGFLAVAQR